MLQGIRALFAFLKRVMSLERHFLPFMLCALVLPSLAVMLIAIISMVSQQKAMEAAVSSYVVDLAESIAYRPIREPKLWHVPSPMEHYPSDSFSVFPFMGTSSRFPFPWGASIPGWVAQISPTGKVIASTPGLRNIAAIWRPDLPIGKATRVTDKQGAQYTLAIYPMASGEGFVIAAVSWDQLLGGIVTVGRMWPALLVLMALGNFIAIQMLWHRLVRPLQSMVAEIDRLRVGRDTSSDVKKGSIKEIKSLQAALLRFSRAAVERDTLRNSYVRDIVQAQEKERMDMAREIHDGPLQDITALLQQIHMSLEEESPQTRIKRTEVLAKSVVRELRGLCDELSPPWMDLGLGETLTELAERLSQTYDVDVTVDFDLATDMPDNNTGENNVNSELSREVTISFMRIFQEAVSNAVRHGGATDVRAQVRLAKPESDDSELVLEVTDNGEGFEAKVDHEKLRLQGHRGLANMTERMSLMGGRLEVTSEIGKGTRVLAALPLKALKAVNGASNTSASNNHV